MPVWGLLLLVATMAAIAAGRWAILRRRQAAAELEKALLTAAWEPLGVPVAGRGQEKMVGVGGGFLDDLKRREREAHETPTPRPRVAEVGAAVIDAEFHDVTDGETRG